MTNQSPITVESFEAPERQCPLCDCKRAVELGVLGRLLWLRCRNCGIDYHVDTADDEESED